MISLLTSFLSLFIELTQISNTVLVSELFAECKPENLSGNLLCEQDSTMALKLLWACLLKSFLMVITFGSRLPGGVFIPSMVVGGCMGRIVGLVTQDILSKFTTVKVIPGVYAMIGSAATLSGVTRMTVSLTIIMFEITGGLTYVLPLMSSIMVAKWVSDAFGRDSVYDMIILVKGYPYLNFKRRNLGPQSYVHSIMQTDHVDMLIDTESCYKIGDIQLKLSKMARLHPSLDGGFAIVKSSVDLTLIGYISQTDLKHALDLVVEGKTDNLDYESMTGSTSPTFPDELDRNIVFYALSVDSSQSPNVNSFKSGTETFTDLSQWVDKAPLTVSSAASCEVVIELFIKLGIRSLLVVKNGLFVGMVHKKRVLAFLRNRFEEEEQQGFTGAIRLD
jgi:chloride channel 3/4/5